jgi:hypothetical protein
VVTLEEGETKRKEKNKIKIRGSISEGIEEEKPELDV